MASKKTKKVVEMPNIGAQQETVTTIEPEKTEEEKKEEVKEEELDDFQKELRSVSEIDVQDLAQKTYEELDQEIKNTQAKLNQETYDNCKIGFKAGFYKSEKAFCEAMEHRGLGEILEKDPDINAVEPSVEPIEAYVLRTKDDTIEEEKENIVVALIHEAGSIVNNIIHRAEEEIDNAEADDAIDKVEVQATDKNSRIEQKTIKDINTSLVKIFEKGSGYVVSTRHMAGAHVYDVVFKDPKGDIMGVYQVDPGYVVPGKNSMFVVLRQDGYGEFIPIDEIDIISNIVLNHQVPTEGEIAEIKDKYYLRNDEIYKYVDVSKIKLTSLTGEEMDRLSDNLTKLVNKTKEFYGATEIQGGARYRVTKYKNPDNVNLLSDTNVTFPYASWGGANSNLVDNTSAKIKNGTLVILNQSGEVIYDEGKSKES